MNSQTSSITLGICAMDEKIRSSPMKLLIQKLKNISNGDVKVILFDSAIINDPIEEWPICNAFLCFYSTGFPLDKAISYCELRKPYEVNNLKTQKLLTNRKKVYQLLEKLSIPTPKKIFITRNCDYCDQIIENDDYIECNGDRIYKPFIEKPYDAEDHNIYIYYPMSQGGGCRRLFRKIGDNSSIYDPNVNNIRKEGSYVYEEFVTLDDAKDVKVYSTPTMSYAELRKSPSVDGQVERNPHGKEMRSVTLLSDQETSLSLRINSAFNQFVCGFDILRGNGQSYVCDVNGWSMVKGNNQDKFYDESSKLLYQILVSVLSTSKPTTPDIQYTQPVLSPPSLSSSSNNIFSYVGNYGKSNFHSNMSKLHSMTKLQTR